jgi:hypothetical protein
MSYRTPYVSVKRMPALPLQLTRIVGRRWRRNKDGIRQNKSWNGRLLDGNKRRTGGNRWKDN